MSTIKKLKTDIEMIQSQTKKQDIITVLCPCNEG